MGFQPKQSDIAAIKAKTDNLPTSPADETTVSAVKDQTDNLPAAPASETGAVARKFTFMDFWSAPEDKITIPAVAADLTFPSIVVSGLPSGLTIERVVLIFFCRALNDTSAADNYINAANKTLRVKKSTGSWGTDDLVALTFAQTSLYCVASSKEAGPTIIGDTDIKSEVDGNATYNVSSEETTRGDALVAFGAELELYDVQVGVRVFFS